MDEAGVVLWSLRREGEVVLSLLSRCPHDCKRRYEKDAVGFMQRWMQGLEKVPLQLPASGSSSDCCRETENRVGTGEDEGEDEEWEGSLWRPGLWAPGWQEGETPEEGEECCSLKGREGGAWTVIMKQHFQLGPCLSAHFSSSLETLIGERGTASPPLTFTLISKSVLTKNTDSETGKKAFIFLLQSYLSSKNQKRVLGREQGKGVGVWQWRCWWKRLHIPLLPPTDSPAARATSTFHSTLFLVHQLALPGEMSVEDPSLGWGGGNR